MVKRYADQIEQRRFFASKNSFFRFFSNFKFYESFLKILEKFNCKGAEAQKILEKINHEETKKALTACTQEALDNGAFGAPWIHVYKDGKIYPFWGSDRFHVIAWLIGEEWQGPLKEKSAKL